MRVCGICWPEATRGVLLSFRRTALKQSFLTGLLLLILKHGGLAQAQTLPRDEQQFCNAFPTFREALRQAHANAIGDSPRQQRQLRQAVSDAARDFQRMAGWRKSRQSVKGWVGEVHSITESTAWGQYFGVSVKVQCGDVIVGIPELAVRRWSNTSLDPMASSCAPSDPYINPYTSFVADLKKLSIGDRVTFAGQFCAIPDSVDDDVIYFVFSKISPIR